MNYQNPNIPQSPNSGVSQQNAAMHPNLLQYSLKNEMASRTNNPIALWAINRYPAHSLNNIGISIGISTGIFFFVVCKMIFNLPYIPSIMAMVITALLFILAVAQVPTINRIRTESMDNIQKRIAYNAFHQLNLQNLTPLTQDASTLENTSSLFFLGYDGNNTPWKFYIQPDGSFYLYPQGS